MFFDPDDELMPDICERLYHEIIKKDADIVTGNAIEISKDSKTLDLQYSENYYEIIPNKDLMLFKPFRCWGTLFKKELIDKYDIKFILRPTNEDTYFCYKCFLNANKIIYLNDYWGKVVRERF